MTLFYSRFEPEAPRLISIHEGSGPFYLACEWVVTPDGSLEQRRPEKRPTLAAVRALVPPGAVERPCPPDWGLGLYEVRA